MDIAEKLLRAKQDLDDVYEAGKKEADDGAFWDVFQDYGNTQNYYYAFAVGRFDDSTYNPKYDIRCSSGTTPGRNIFYNSKITDTKVNIYANNNNLYQCFSGAAALETIRLLSVYETTVLDDAFKNCESLKNITFEGVIGQDFDIHWSPLTKESIESIISHLSDAATGKTVTLDGGNIQSVFATDPSIGDTDGDTTEEWLNLVASKPNWTISLV